MTLVSPILDEWSFKLLPRTTKDDGITGLVGAVQSLENVIFDTVNEVWNEVRDIPKPMPRLSINVLL